MASGLAVAVYGLLLVPVAVLVWRRPVFALYAWIVGLAAHNAVMAALYGAGVRGGALTAIQAWKEVLLGVALARVALEALRAGRLAFRVHPADVVAVAFAAVVCVYAVLPQDWLGGTADWSAIGLALKHDLVPVGAYFLGRSVIIRGEELVRLVWTIVGTAAVVAVLGLLDDFLVPISWWRDFAVVDYFHKHLGYDYHGTGGLPENFVFNNGGDAEGFYRRLVSTFLGPLASAYAFVVALLLGAAFLRRPRILIPLSAVIFAGLLFTFSRSSLLALAAGLVVLAFVTRRWWPVAAAVATLAVSVAWVHVFPHVAPTGNWTQQDLVQQRNHAKARPGASGSAGSIDEPSIHSHWISLREGVRTVVHHPQGYGLGNAGQTASRTGARGSLAGVAEAVSLRMVDDRAHTFPETDPVAVNRRLVDAAGATARSRPRLRVVALLHQILLRPLARRCDVREDVHPRHADGERRDGGSDRPPAPRDESEHEQARCECKQ